MMTIPDNQPGADDATTTQPDAAVTDAFRETRARFSQAIAQSRHYVFYDGMNSPLAETIHDAIAGYGTIAVQSLRSAMDTCPTDTEAVEEILRQVGLVIHPPTQDARLELLSTMIASPDARVRDAAMLGISFIDDPAALPCLQAARDRETVPWLVNGLQQVIDQLEQTCLENPSRPHPPP